MKKQLCNGLRNIRSKVRPPKPKDAHYTVTPDFSKQVIELSDTLSDILIQNNLSKYLMTDCPVICGVFHPCFTETQLYNTLNPIMIGILNYLHLPQIVRLDIQSKKSDMHKAGKYCADTVYSKVITIYADIEHSCESILAVLCHECTHFFMDHYNLNVNDEKENEIRTDIYANLIGFNMTMTAGYKPRNNIRIGYISSDDCSLIYHYLTYKRKMITGIDDIQKSVSTAKVLYEQVMFLYNNIAESEQARTTKKFIRSFRKFAAIDIPTIIDNCERKQVQTKNLSEVMHANDTLCYLCTNMANYIQHFQK